MAVLCMNCMQGAVYYFRGHTLFIQNQADAFYAVGTAIYIEGGHVNFTLNTAFN